MFSFIKFIQSILDRLKKNKGLWFTLLTIISVMGILISMTLINKMSTDVAKKTYLQEHRVDVSQLENVFDLKYDSLLSIGGIVSIHPDIIANIKSKSDKSVNDLLLKAQKAINERVINPIELHYYAYQYKTKNAENHQYADVAMETQTSITGVVVNRKGIKIITITPIIDNNQSIGAIEVSEPISSLRNAFEKMGKEFVFILHKSQLVFIDLETKQGMLQNINDDYVIFYHNYNPQFFNNLKKIPFDVLLPQKYYIDDSYYTTYDDAVDIDGKKIGLFVIGESSKETNSFVNITKNLINSITTVALGLVISLILFMF